MKIVFMGTPDFAVPSLKRLIEEYGTSKNLPFITQSNIKFGLFCIPLQTSSSYRYDIW